MDLHFKALSLSYKHAPVEVREVVALDEASIRKLLHQAREVLGLQEMMVVSTCNRTELYYTNEKELTNELINLLGICKGRTDLKDYKAYFEQINNAEKASEHLFRVSMGIESQVVGDIQISNQIKNAYQWAADAQLAGPFLHRLMHTIFFTNKRVQQETNFRDGAASVSYAAAELVEELSTNLHDARVLVLGLGEIGQEVSKNLHHTGIENIRITNRTYKKAEDLGTALGFEVVDFKTVDEQIEWADIIISSVAKPEFINLKSLEPKMGATFKYMLDLSMPRSISPEVENLPGAILYNIDEIRNRTDEVVEKRKASIPDVESIISEALESFDVWREEMLVSPTIHKLKGALEQIRKEELAHFAKKMDEEQLKLMEQVTKRMMQKVINVPVLQLKAACKRGEAETLMDVLNDIFQLEDEESLVKK